MNLVLDTNVLIAALISRGTCADLLEHCVLRHSLVSSAAIFAELETHLLGKFKYSPAEVDAVASLLKPQMEIVIPVKLDAPACRDPDDDMILATAIAGSAECIVTGDKDLLIMNEFQGVKIVSPGDFPEFEIEQERNN